MTDVAAPLPSSSAGAPKTRRRLIRWLVLLAAFGIALWLVRPLVTTFAISQAREKLEKREHDSALSWLNFALSLESDRAETHFLIARTYRRLEDFRNVHLHLKRAYDLGWDRKELEREQHIALAQTGRYSEMAKHFPDLFLNAGSDGPEISKAYVLMLMSQFRLQPAMKVLQAWENDFPEDPQPHILRGRALGVIRNWSEAEREYKHALELDPENSEALFELAHSLMKQLRFKEAQPILKKCLQNTPSHVKAAVASAVCLRKQNQNNQARAFLLQHWGLIKNNLEALREMGHIELAAEHPKEAVKHLRYAVKMNPVDRETRYLLSQAFRAAGMTAEAQKERAFVNLATKPVLRLGQLVPKLIDDPGNIALRFEIAEITWKYKSRTEGAQWLHSLLHFEPNHIPTHKLLAQHYQQTGHPQKSEFHRRKGNPTETTEPSK